MTASLPYPLLFEPILLAKPWGGERLREFDKQIAAGAKVGESWELADLAATSTSGAGGAAACTKIANGALASSNLRAACSLWGEKLMGDVARASDGGFPLLIKFLDARENLSVQVHPSPAYARAHAGAHLKTECWYIMSAEPGAKIYKGVKAGVTREAFEKALRKGDGSACVDLLESVPAVVGECHNLPSGTVHALGAGVLVAEVQTPSDTTFRVYDWGRIENGKPRQLHIEQSLECIQWEQARDATKIPNGQRRATLVSTGYFDVEVVRGPALTAETGASYKDRMLRPGATTAFPLRGNPAGKERPIVIMMLGGHGTLATNGLENMAISSGQTVLVPACLVREATIEVSDRGMAILASPR